jgi:DHA1 family tetracycline resistance protein-like MFS transporter
MNGRHEGQQTAIVFILITLFIDILGIGIVVPVLPELIKQLAGGGNTLASRYVGLIAATYSLMQFTCAPLLGALSDRFGRRPILLASLFGLGIDFLIQGLAPSIGWLFLGRLLAGIMGASVTTANAYIADVSTPATRARNYGLVGVMFGLGFIFGPALGGVLGQVHLRLPFFASAALALLNCLYGLVILPESLPREQRTRFSLSNAMPVTGTISALFAHPIVAGLAVAFVFTSLAHRALENVWVLYTSYRFGWDELTNGLTLGLVGLMAVLVQGLLVRRSVALLGDRRAALLGLSISALAFLGYGLAYRGWMMLVIIVFGSLGGITGPAIQNIIGGVVPSAAQGKTQGAISSLMGLTSILAPLIFTAGLFGYFTSDRAPVELPGAPFLVGSALIFTALVIVHRVFRRHPADRSHA